MSIAEDISKLQSQVSELSLTLSKMTQASLENVKKIGEYKSTLSSLKNKTQIKPDKLFQQSKSITQFKLSTINNIQKPDIVNMELPTNYNNNVKNFKQNFDNEYTQYRNQNIQNNVSNLTLISQQQKERFDYNKYQLPEIL